MSNNMQPPEQGRGPVAPMGQPSFSQFAANPANLAPGLFGPTPPGFGNRQGFAPPVSPFTSTSGLGGNPGMVGGGIGGANTPELQNLRTVMRTITTELQGLARVIQQVNRGAGVAGGAGGGVAGGVGGGVAGGTGGLPGGVPGAIASSVRFRDTATGRFVSADQAGVTRTLNAGAVFSGGGAGVGQPQVSRTGLPTAPSPFNVQDARNVMRSQADFNAYMGGRPAGERNTLSAMAQSDNPVIARAAVNTQRQFPGATYVNPDSNNATARLIARNFTENTLGASAAQQMEDQPGGYYGPGGRPVANFVRGAFNRPGRMGQRVTVPSAQDIMTELNIPNDRQGRAAVSQYRRQLQNINQGVESNEAQFARGRAVGSAAAFVGKATLGISGASASQIASSIPFVGGLVSAPFQVAEGLAGQFGNEYAAAVARGSQGLAVGSGRQNIEALYGLRRFGITADQAAAFGTEYGSITGKEFGATQVGLMARGLAAGQVGQVEMMGIMGAGFNARTTGGGSFGLRAMGAAQGMGIQGVQSQLGFAQALASAGQGLLGQGAIVDVNRFMGGVRGIAAGGRVTGTDAITLQASGQSAIQSGTRGFLSSMFGDLDQSLTFSRLLSQNGGDIAAAARAAEQETPQQRIAANIKRFGKAGELGAITSFGANATTEFRRGAGAGGLGEAIEGVDITGGTQASSRVLGTQMKQVGIAYDNENKIIAVLEANNRLQEELMKAVTPEFIDGVSASLTTIASATTSILNFVVSNVMKYTGSTAQPLPPMKAGGIK